MKVLLVLPARYASQRLERKMLADICGEPLVLRTYKRVQALADVCDIVLATDHAEIAAVVEAVGARVLLTSEQASSGTMRCAEALQQLITEGKNYDFVLNVQADELFVEIGLLRALIANFAALPDDAGILTAMQPIQRREDLENPSIVKVVYQKNTLPKGANLRLALYFSRAPLPYPRSQAQYEQAAAAGLYCRHIGVYGFRAKTLLDIAAQSHLSSPLESCEMLEQLRWLEDGKKIVLFRHEPSADESLYAFGIDTAEDLQRARQLLATPPSPFHNNRL